MRLNKNIILILILILSVINTYAKDKCEPIDINFKGLKIESLISISAKLLNKNILKTHSINGNVGFTTNKKVCKNEIFDILMYVLASKGYTIISNGNILRVIKLSESSKNNLPVVSGKIDKKYFQMITQIWTIDYVNVDYISSKVRHLLSRSSKIITDKISNTIMITDFPSNIKTIQRVISIIAKDKKKYIVTHTLKNISATSLAGELKKISKSIFNETIQKEKIDILVNKDTNSIMLVGKKKNVLLIEKELLRIDKKSSLIEKVVRVIGLKNIESKNVIKTINAIIKNKAYGDKNNKPFISTDNDTNSIIIIGPKDQVSYIEKLINKLDIDRQQVYVKVRIIEISESGVRNLGVNWGFNGYKSGTDGLTSFSSSLNSLKSPAIPLSSLGTYGFSLDGIKSAISLGAAINLLYANEALDIVSEPSVVCINNKESTIYAGETRSIPTGKTVGTTTTTNYKREDIGLSLKVKPRISNGNKVTLEIKTVLEDVKETKSDGPPSTNKKEISTTVIVGDGESVILGGLIKNKKENTESKIPILGDIPILGWLFRSKNEINDRINLVIVMTPYIISKTQNLTGIRNKLAQLKLLEDKYLKDLTIVLKKKQLKAKKDDIVREEERIELDTQEEELHGDQIDFAEDEIEYQKDKKERLSEPLDKDDKVYNKRAKELFGN